MAYSASVLQRSTTPRGTSNSVSKPLALTSGLRMSRLTARFKLRQFRSRPRPDCLGWLFWDCSAAAGSESSFLPILLVHIRTQRLMNPNGVPHIRVWRGRFGAEGFKKAFEQPPKWLPLRQDEDAFILTRRPMLIASSFDGVIPWILAALAGIFLLGATSVVLSARGHWAGVLLAVPLLMPGIVGIRSLMTDTHRDTLSLESWAINLSPLALCATSVTLWLRHQVGPRKGRAPSSPRSYDPDTPLFELFVADKKVGVLCEPKREEMFWCSYRIEPSSEEA